MQKVLTAEEMREVDRLTTEKYGIPSIILMENAAHAAAAVIKEKSGGSVAGKSFLILCGKGNNGGDGAALARILAIQGAFVEVILFGNIEDTKGDARTNFEIFRRNDSKSELWDANDLGEFRQQLAREDWDKFFYNSCQDWDVVVDAVFGTGLTRKLEVWLGNVIRHLNVSNEVKRDFKQRIVVSIDIPSGLNADSSQPIGENFQADLTVTFTAPKLANVLPPASNFNGELIVANIGSPQGLINNSPSKTFLAERQDAQEWLEKTEFSSASYKNKRGHALLVAGSDNYAGAAVLAGNSAIVSGVGLVTVATSQSAQNSIASRVLPEVMTRGVAETDAGAVSAEAFDELDGFIEKSIDAVLIGSGLSSSDKSTKDLVKILVAKRRTPLVLDADGLNALSPFKLKGSDEFPLVLTPHEGEFLRLLGTKDREVLKDRVAVVREFARKHHVILVLKGERTLIASPDGRVVINPTGNSGLGKAGNGDTLAGIITGFIAQAMKMEKNNSFYTPVADPKIFDVFDAVVAAIYIAGLAGDIAAEKYGKRSMLASDVRESLKEAFQSITN